MPPFFLGGLSRVSGKVKTACDGSVLLVYSKGITDAICMFLNLNDLANFLDDQVLLQFMQVAMMRHQQAMRARAGVGASVAPSSAPASGLWTPGQSTEPTPNVSSNSGGGGKLWIPGQD